MKFEITEKNIQDYLWSHKDDQNIKYREAMFVKYMREQENLTKEALEILMWRYNDADVKPAGIYMDCPRSSYKMFHELSDFNDYLKKIKNLDISGICHILIPTMKLYGKSEIHINHLYANVGIVSDELVVSMEHPMEIIKSSIDDYRICGKVEEKDDMIYIKMGKEHCRRELLVYQDFYNEDKVKRIRKIIREGM